MAILQQAYTSRTADLALGQIRNIEQHNIVSRLLEDAAALGFGRAVFKGVRDNGVTATPTAGTFEGVTIRSESVEGAGDTFVQYETMPVMKTIGVTAVEVAAAVTKQAQAYVTPAGVWTSVSAGNTIIPGATFDGTTAGAGLVPLRLA